MSNKKKILNMEKKNYNQKLYMNCLQIILQSINCKNYNIFKKNFKIIKKNNMMIY